MNVQAIQSSWSDTKAKIKAKWAKFNDIELESFKDGLDKLSDQIQKSYGIAKEQAEKESGDFRASLQPQAQSQHATITPDATFTQKVAVAPITTSFPPAAKASATDSNNSGTPKSGAI